MKRVKPVYVLWAALAAAFVVTGCSGAHPPKSKKHGLAASAWPRFGGDSGNSGLAHGHGATGKRKWTFHAGKAINGSPALGPDGTVYIWSYDGYLYALDHRTGKQKWQTLTLNFSLWKKLTKGTREGIEFMSPSPAVGANGLVYIASQDGCLYALDAKNGSRQWRFATGDWIESSPNIGPDGTVFIVSRDENLYAVNGNTGRMKWKRKVGLVQCYPAVGHDGTVYTADTSSVTGAESTCALDGATGQKKWEWPGVNGQIALSSNGILCVAGDEKVWALDAKTGTKIWEYPMRGVVVSTPAIGPDGTVYVGSSKGFLCALNGASGKPRWKFKRGEAPLMQPSIASDGTVYVAGQENLAPHLYALDPNTGCVKWVSDVGEGASRGAAIGRDGTIFIGSWDGMVYAVD